MVVPLTFGPVEIAGVAVGLERLVVLAALPVALAVLAVLLFRGGARSPATRPERLGLLVSRMIVVVLLVGAAAGPFTVTATTTPSDPSVTLLEDQSASTVVRPNVAQDLASAIEANGVRVERQVIASGNRSPIGEGLLANLRENGSILLVSDGRVTEGRTLSSVRPIVESLNATVNRVGLDVDSTELAVNVSGPATTTVDVPNRFTVSVSGVAVTEPDAQLSITIDGVIVRQVPITKASRQVVVEHNFTEIGAHRLTARLEIDDQYSINNVYRKTVRVVPKPHVLYVSNGSYRLERYLERLYNVTTVDAVPPELAGYHAVVTQNLPATGVGNATALQRYVLEGHGLMMVGGDSAFELGNYTGTPMGAMAPVRPGDRGGQRARVIIAIDISDSAYEQHDLKKALAINAVRQLSDDSAVGVLAFDDDAYEIAPLQPLGESRAAIEERIARIDNGLGTDIPGGIQAARAMLNGEPGSVIFLSDGIGDPDDEQDLRNIFERARLTVYPINVGNRTEPKLLQLMAGLSGGTYLKANQTNRLRIFFGDSERQFEGKSLTILDQQHFITRNVRSDVRLARSNRVSVKRGASYLVATSAGDPAVAAWRYGVGRVVSITAFAEDGGLDGLLARPDSLMVSRSVNWAIGDPRRETDRVFTVPDTRVGRVTTVTYRGENRPNVSGLSFAQAGTNRYEATFRPSTMGYHEIDGTEYAVNYPREYGGFGRAAALRSLVRGTGGETFTPDEGAEIATAVVEQTRSERNVREDWTWALLVAGLAVLFLEIALRRVRRFVGRGTLP